MMTIDARTALAEFIVPAGPAKRRTRQASVRWGSHVVTVGGDAPVRVHALRGPGALRDHQPVRGPGDASGTMEERVEKLEAEQLEYGFLPEDQEVILTVRAANLDAVKKDLGHLRRRRLEAEIEIGVPKEDGTIEVRLTYYRGTPLRQYERVTKRLGVIEARNS